jgi:hypothetical protein
MAEDTGLTSPEIEEDACAAANDYSRQGLRIGAIFIILVRSPLITHVWGLIIGNITIRYIITDRPQV